MIKLLSTVAKILPYLTGGPSKNIKEGDTIRSVGGDIPRFGGDTEYSIQPGIALVVKEQIRGVYYDNKVFRPDPDGEVHFLIEGRNAFVSNYTGHATDALYIPAEIAKDRFVHTSKVKMAA